MNLVKQALAALVFSGMFIGVVLVFPSPSYEPLALLGHLLMVYGMCICLYLTALVVVWAGRTLYGPPEKKGKGL